MVKEATFRSLEEIESESMRIKLSASAQRTAVTIQEYVSIRQINGAEEKDILAELLDDLQNNGRIFGEFRNAIRATAHGNIKRVSDIGNYTENGTEIEYKWITVEDDKVCPDCSERHNMEMTWDKWADTLPGSGWSVCKDHCRCFLVPKEAPGMIPSPIKRKRT